MGRADAVFTRGPIAIRGFDPVAYFNEEKPVIGYKNITYKWIGAIWPFSSETNRKSFMDHPKKCVPQYGGYGAYAASKGSLAPTDPKAWTLYKGKLYLNYSRSVRDIWSEDNDGYISAADERWTDLKTGG